jgi:hypothetical protein
MILDGSDVGDERCKQVVETVATFCRHLHTVAGKKKTEMTKEMLLGAVDLLAKCTEE